MERIIYYLLYLFTGKSYAAKTMKVRRMKRMNAILRKYGVEALEAFNVIAEKHGIDYWLFWGTLLGAYREHDFIKHDEDLDVGLFANDITLSFIDDLIQHGFNFIDAIVDVHYDGQHIAMSYKGLKFDLYGFQLSENKETMTGFTARAIDGGWSVSRKENKCRVVRVTVPYDGFKYINFKGINVKVPSKEENSLKVLYGDDFMIPKAMSKAKEKKGFVIEPLSKTFAKIYNYSEFKQLKENGLI